MNIWDDKEFMENMVYKPWRMIANTVKMLTERLSCSKRVRPNRVRKALKQPDLEFEAPATGSVGCFMAEWRIARLEWLESWRDYYEQEEQKLIWVTGLPCDDMQQHQATIDRVTGELDRIRWLIAQEQQKVDEVCASEIDEFQLQKIVNSFDKRIINQDVCDYQKQRVNKIYVRAMQKKSRRVEEV